MHDPVCPVSLSECRLCIVDGTTESRGKEQTGINTIDYNNERETDLERD